MLYIRQFYFCGPLPSGPRSDDSHRLEGHITNRFIHLCLQVENSSIHECNVVFSGLNVTSYFSEIHNLQGTALPTVLDLISLGVFCSFRFQMLDDSVVAVLLKPDFGF